MLSLLWVLLFSVFCLYVPGRLLTDLLVEDPEPEEILPYALTLGLSALCVAATLGVGISGIASHVYLTRTWVLVTSGCITAVALAARFRRSRRQGRSTRPWLRRPSRHAVALGLLTLVAVAFYALRYDYSHFAEDSCNVRSIMAVTTDYFRHETLQANNVGGDLSHYQALCLLNRADNGNVFLLYNQGQRIGMTVLGAPLVAVFETLGFRLLFAVPGLLLVGLGFLLGRRLFRARWAPWATAVLLAFNPYALEIDVFDENVSALCFGTFAWVALMRPKPAVAVAGAAMGMMLGIRPEAIILLPLLLAYLGRITDRPWPATWAFTRGLLTFGAPVFLMHLGWYLTQGELFEGAGSRPNAPHELFGLVPFELPVLLNWPFVPEPLRAPYAAFPTLVAFPLDLVRRFGVLAIALMVVGGLRLRRTLRGDAILFGAWFLLFLAMGMIQSNWIEPDKMGVPATTLTVPIALLVAGIVELLDDRLGWRHRLLLLGGAFVGVYAVALAIWSTGPAMLDGRVYVYRPWYLHIYFEPSYRSHAAEDDAYLAWDRRRLFPRPWPSIETGTAGPSGLRGRGAELVRQLAEPGFEAFRSPLMDYMTRLPLDTGRRINPVSIRSMLSRGEPTDTFGPPALPDPERCALDGQPTVEVELDLATAPLEPATPLALKGATTAAGGALVQADGCGVVWVSGWQLAWSDQPTDVGIARDRDGTVVIVIVPGAVSSFDVPEPIEVTRIDAARFPDGKIRVLVPEGAPIRLYDVRSMHPTRTYVRDAIAGADGVWISDTRLISVF